MPEPKIPECKSNLPLIGISITRLPENLAEKGGGDRLLEDWVWEVTIENGGNPFCPEIRSWGVYIVRSVTEQPINFKNNGHSSVFQLFPGDIPTLLVVDDVTVDRETGIALTVLYERPKVGLMKHHEGLYMYHS
jgi:hypothetical protein